MERQRILIVEDSPTMRQLLVFALRRLASVDIVEAQDGMDGLRKLSSDHFDLALIDINMPVMDGLKLIGLMRSEDSLREVPVVVITTEGAEQDRERALRLGANEYLTKPIQANRVLAVVRDLLARGSSLAPAAGAERVPRGAELRARILAASALLSLGGVLLISLYLVALLRLPPEQWRGFAWIVGGLFPVLFAAQALLQRRVWLPIVAALDRRADGSATPAELRAGFAGVANLPIDLLARGGVWWLVGGCLVAAGMRLAFPGFSWLLGAIMVAGAASGGFVMMVFHFLL